MRQRVTPDDGFEALLEPFYNGKSLTDPISTKEDKFQLLPAFLKVKGKLPLCAKRFLAAVQLIFHFPRSDQATYRLLQLLHRP